MLPSEWDLDLMIVPAGTFERPFAAAEKDGLEDRSVRYVSFEHLIAPKGPRPETRRGTAQPQGFDRCGHAVEAQERQPGGRVAEGSIPSKRHAGDA